MMMITYTSRKRMSGEKRRERGTAPSVQRRRKKKRRKWKGEGTREKEARVDSGVMYVGMTSESVGARPPCEYIEAFGRHYGAIRAVCRGETLIYTERQRQLSLPLPPPGGSRIIPFTEIIPRTVGEMLCRIFATLPYRRKGDAYTLLIAFLYTEMKSFCARVRKILVE